MSCLLGKTAAQQKTAHTRCDRNSTRVVLARQLRRFIPHHRRVPPTRGPGYSRYSVMYYDKTLLTKCDRSNPEFIVYSVPRYYCTAYPYIIIYNTVVVVDAVGIRFERIRARAVCNKYILLYRAQNF